MFKKLTPGIVGLYLGIHTFIYLALQFVSIDNGTTNTPCTAYDLLARMNNAVGITFGVMIIVFMVVTFLLFVMSIISVIKYSTQKGHSKLLGHEPNMFIEILIYLYSICGVVLLITILAINNYHIMFGSIIITFFTLATGLTILILEITGKLDRALFEILGEAGIRHRERQIAKLELKKQRQDERRLKLEADMEKVMQFDFIDPVETELQKKRKQLEQEKREREEKKREQKRLAKQKRRSKEGIELKFGEPEENTDDQDNNNIE